jgi:hypothetical protein
VPGYFARTLWRAYRAFVLTILRDDELHDAADPF